MISAKTRRNIERIIPFGVIWLITGWFFLFSDITSGYHRTSPDSSVAPSIPVIIFASIALVVVGMLVGIIELVILERKFRYHRLITKVINKFLIYFGFMLLIILISFPIATSIEQRASVFSPEVWAKTKLFFGSFTFINTILQVSFYLILSLIYTTISENIGHQNFLNIVTGRYHKAVIEKRIFMFLDMKKSTTIAEHLGHQKYFNLLQEYYELMSESIINHRGEVYQYIGDEVVITWQENKGLESNNCINCFYAIKEKLREYKDKFQSKHGFIPDFKAGIHVGSVSTGEIGALKREIVYTGDVLNTTARIQGLCNEHDTDLIITNRLLKRLENPDLVKNTPIGELSLKGKNKKVSLHKINGISEQ